MQTADFDYILPPELIAQDAIEPRDAARLLHYSLGNKLRQDKHVKDLPHILRPDDLLVLNTTKVFPARLFGEKDTGGQIEILLIHPIQPGAWRCMIRGKVRENTELLVDKETFTVTTLHENGERDIRFDPDLDIFAFADKHGHIPLPPYIKREDNEADRTRYQSVFAQQSGSVAAPTASLHFTESLLNQLGEMGVEQAHVELHVGPGTFKPVNEERIEDYHIHKERCICPIETVNTINRAKKEGRRVIAVGTTVVRTLETAARQETGFNAFDGWSELFLYPPHEFKVVDGLLTNFHLPKSSLLMLVSCLCGREELLELYQHAIHEAYRFYSYGDAMLILP